MAVRDARMAGKRVGRTPTKDDKKKGPPGLPPLCVVCKGNHFLRPCPTLVMAKNPEWAKKPDRMSIRCFYAPTVGPYKGKQCRGFGHTDAHHRACQVKALRVIKQKATSQRWGAAYTQPPTNHKGKKPWPAAAPRRVDATRPTPKPHPKGKGKGRGGGGKG